MRVFIAALALVVATPAVSGKLMFPDPDVSVPPLVKAFIHQTCGMSFGTSDAYAPCVNGEMGGYRATVEMLIDTDAPDRVTEHYRACARISGIDTNHFHRTRAKCMGTLEGIDWRFEAAGKA